MLNWPALWSRDRYEISCENRSTCAGFMTRTMSIAGAKGTCLPSLSLQCHQEFCMFQYRVVNGVPTSNCKWINHKKLEKINHADQNPSKKVPQNPPLLGWNHLTSLSPQLPTLSELQIDWMLRKVAIRNARAIRPFKADRGRFSGRKKEQLSKYVTFVYIW